MPDDSEKIEALEAQITAIADTERNLTGLVEKVAGIQGDLLNAGLQAYSDRVGEPFSALSNAAEQLQSLGHDLEIERNRLRNESD